MSFDNRVPLPGSEKSALEGSKVLASANPDEVIQVTLRLKPKQALDSKTLQKNGSLPVQQRHRLTHEEYEQQHGAHPDDIAKVEQFAHEHGLAVAQTDIARRTILLTGTVAAFSSAFGVELKQYEFQGTRFRGRTGAIHIPQELGGIVTGVFGLDNRPAAKPHFRRKAAGRLTAHAAATSFTPVQVATAYNFPENLDGAGQTIAIIELGGGYRTRDLSAYFKQQKIKEPKISAVSVDGGHNHATGDPGGPDGEVMLDIEVAGAVSPGAKYVVYFAPNTDAGFLDAITTAVHDTTRKPSIISISWGGPEANWTQQSLTAFDEAFQAAASLGVTVFAAAGDNGSTDGLTDGQQHVDFPASDPFVISCGGTNLQLSGGKLTQSVWNDGVNGGATGGGVSDVFPLPDYQKNANVPKSVNDGQIRRTVPDIAADADPNTGYQILVDGQTAVFGGTSAVAPLFAALLAKINQQAGQPLGFIHPLLYGQAQAGGAITDVTQGDNGSYKASVGFDACTGLGSPDGAKLAGVLAPKSTARGDHLTEVKRAAS